jgi:hypothetical protein
MEKSHAERKQPLIGDEPPIVLRDGKHEEKNLGNESHGPIHGSQG